MLEVDFRTDSKVSTSYVISRPSEAIKEIYVGGIGSFVRLTSLNQREVEAALSLDRALEIVAKLNTPNLVFTYKGDTYIFGDLLDNDVLNANDLLVKIVGTTKVARIIDLLNT